MKDFLKFILVKTFYDGFRKFITMGAIVYAIYNLGGAPNINQDFAEFSEDETQEFTKDDSGRLPAAASDNLDSQKIDRTKATVRQKSGDFFEDADSRATNNGAENTVNDLVNELGGNANSVDRDRGVSRLPSQVDTENSDQNSDSTGIEESSNTEGCDVTDPTCGGPGSSNSDIIDSTDDEEEEPRAPTIPQAPNTITCSADRPQGLYGASLAVNLSCSETAQIYWCVQMGTGMTCDPYNTPTNYTGTIDLNTGDGVYNLSYYGRTNDGGVSPVYDLIYTIDSTLPALVVNFPFVQVQSTELPFVNETQSTDFGKANHFYHQINLKTNDPTATGLNWNCEEIFTQYASLVAPAPLVIQTELATEGLTITDQIDQSIDSAKLTVGDNYVVTLFEDRTRNLFSCQVQKVLLEDTFNAAFTGTGSTPIFTGVRKTAGGFVGFGHFQNVPNATTSGSNENQQGLTVNKADLFSIVY